eukprot:3599413-Prymnesium_polylepis.2
MCHACTQRVRRAWVALASVADEPGELGRERVLERSAAARAQPTGARVARWSDAALRAGWLTQRSAARNAASWARHVTKRKRVGAFARARRGA